MKLALANEEPGTKNEEQIFGLANELTLMEDGWACIAPYGDHLHHSLVRTAEGVQDQRLLQRVNPESAQALADSFNGLTGKLRRFFVGAPLYSRHPDLIDYSPENIHATEPGDKITAGLINQLRAGETGLEAQITVTHEGQEIIERDKLKFISPYWFIDFTGEVVDGVPVVVPSRLISGGLTDRPNISGGQPLANQAPPENQPKQNPMKSIITILLARGVAIANNAPDEEVEQAVIALCDQADRAKALANEADSHHETLTQIQKDLAEEKKGHEATRAALANAREDVVTTLLDNAIREQRIEQADRPAWESKFADADKFDETRRALANEKPANGPTSPVTANLGDRKITDAKSASTEFMALANELLDAGKVKDWDAAWNRAKQDNPELFKLMNGKEPAQN